MTKQDTSETVEIEGTPVTISNLRREQHTFNGEGWAARVECDGFTYMVSQLDGETYWVIDAKFGPNSYPYWCHGFGSRCTALTGLSEPISAAVDAYVFGIGVK